MRPVGILVLEMSDNLQSVTAERSSGEEGWLPATVVSYHVAGVCSCGTFNTHPEVCCSKGGRKGSIILASLVGSGVGSGSVVPLSHAHTNRQRSSKLSFRSVGVGMWSYSSIRAIVFPLPR